MLQGKYPLLIALVLGLLAGIIAYSAIKAREHEVREGWDTVRILCARVDVEAGTELDEEMVGDCLIPSKFVTDSFIRIPEGEEAATQMPYGQKVLVPLKAGDPVLGSHFEAERDFILADSVPARARAISVEVNERSSVNNWIRPNDHVDVVGTFRDRQTSELIAVTLLENLIVLATGKHSGMNHMSEEDKKYSQVVLLVGPEEAEILALAQETGTVTLVMRNPRDMDVAEARTTKTDTQTLITGERSRILLTKRQATWQQPIEMIGGTMRKRERNDPKSTEVSSD